jgi:hypothetical protein
MIKEFPAFYGTWGSISMFTRVPMYPSVFKALCNIS